MLVTKKQQTSIFIVIGAILVIVSAFLIATSDFSFFMSTEDRLKNQVSTVVEDCVRDAMNRGAFLLGSQGGYIYLNSAQRVNPAQYVDFGVKIPNWASAFNQAPTVDSMTQELERFVEEESYSCAVSDLRSLEGFLSMNISDEMDVSTSINDENVATEVNFPVEFSEANVEGSLTVEDYFVQVRDLRLGDMFELARQIYQLEQEEYFMEDLVMEQIYTASDYAESFSMPSEGMEFSCTRRIWTKPQLKENLANLNNNNFKYLQFESTYPMQQRLLDVNLGQDNQDMRQYFRNIYRYELPEPQSSFSNYRVEVLMPSVEVTGEEGITQRYPFRTFEVTPSDGNIVKSMDLDVGGDAFEIPIPCIQLYHHLYELDYDMIVKITDYTESGERYSFQFPLRVSIKDNQPKEGSSLDMDFQEQTATDDEFCDPQNREYPLKVFVKDSRNGNYLNGANISYQCINLECDVGQTQKPEYQGVTRQAATPRLSADFPYCVGGQLKAELNGYHSNEVRVDTTEDLQNRDTVQIQDIEVTPTKEFLVDESSFLITFADGRGKRVLDSSDGSIYVSIENQGREFSSQAIWPSDSSRFRSLELLAEPDVKYNVSVLYASSDYQLQGMLELENWEAPVFSGDEMQFVIPGRRDQIDSDQYVDFYDAMKLRVEEGDAGIIFI